MFVIRGCDIHLQISGSWDPYTVNSEPQTSIDFKERRSRRNQGVIFYSIGRSDVNKRSLLSRDTASENPLKPASPC